MLKRFGLVCLCIVIALLVWTLVFRAGDSLDRRRLPCGASGFSSDEDSSESEERADEILAVIDPDQGRLVVTDGLAVGTYGLATCMAVAGTNGRVTFCAHLDGDNVAEHVLPTVCTEIWETVAAKVKETESELEFRIFFWGCGEHSDGAKESMERAKESIIKAGIDREFAIKLDQTNIILFEDTQSYKHGNRFLDQHGKEHQDPLYDATENYLTFGAIDREGEGIFTEKTKLNFVEAEQPIRLSRHEFNVGDEVIHIKAESKGKIVKIDDWIPRSYTVLLEDEALLEDVGMGDLQDAV